MQTLFRSTAVLALVSSAWSVCPPGHLQKASGECMPCELGTFSPGGLASACTPCPLGSTSQHTGAASSLECVYCLSGYAYTPHKSTRCTPCQVAVGVSAAHQRQQCESEPFGGDSAQYRNWGFSNIDRALQKIQGNRGMEEIRKYEELEEVNFVNNLTYVPDRLHPRAGVATVQDFYEKDGTEYVRRNISSDSNCHVFNVWQAEGVRDIKDICFEDGTDKNTNNRDLLSQLRGENYCAIRATQNPFVVHILPVHRARNQISAQKGCGFLKNGPRQVKDFPVDEQHIQSTLQHYDLRKFMYGHYTRILGEKLHEKITTEILGPPPLQKVVELAPALRIVNDTTKFRPGCLDDDLYSQNSCQGVEEFKPKHETCEQYASDSEVSETSVLHFLYQQMHCTVPNSTLDQLEAMVDGVTAEIGGVLPDFVDDPQGLVIDNPCHHSTSAAKVSINGGEWQSVAALGEAKTFTWPGPPQRLHVSVQTEDGQCAFQTSLVLNATQQGVVFGDKTGDCGADMEHAREFAFALKRFDALVAAV